MRTVYRIHHDGRIDHTTDRTVAALASAGGARVAAVTRPGP
jgi:hypothetical protein